MNATGWIVVVVLAVVGYLVVSRLVTTAPANQVGAGGAVGPPSPPGPDQTLSKVASGACAAGGAGGASSLCGMFAAQTQQAVTLLTTSAQCSITMAALHPEWCQGGKYTGPSASAPPPATKPPATWGGVPSPSSSAPAQTLAQTRAAVAALVANMTPAQQNQAAQQINNRLRSFGINL
jgi:hypothetical protein